MGRSRGPFWSLSICDIFGGGKSSIIVVVMAVRLGIDGISSSSSSIGMEKVLQIGVRDVQDSGDHGGGGGGGGDDCADVLVVARGVEGGGGAREAANRRRRRSSRLRKICSFCRLFGCSKMRRWETSKRWLLGFRRQKVKWKLGARSQPCRSKLFEKSRFQPAAAVVFSN